MKELIINQSGLVKTHQKVTAVGLTLLFWAALIYMWLPLISLIAWFFNIKLFYNHMLVLGGYKAFLSLTIIYASIVFVISGTLFLWAKSNELRFRGKDRRSEIATVQAKDMAKTFKVKEEQVHVWQKSKRSVVLLDDSGNIIDIKSREQLS